MSLTITNGELNTDLLNQTMVTYQTVEQFYGRTVQELAGHIKQLQARLIEAHEEVQVKTVLYEQTLKARIAALETRVQMIEASQKERELEVEARLQALEKTSSIERKILKDVYDEKTLRHAFKKKYGIWGR